MFVLSRNFTIKIVFLFQIAEEDTEDEEIVELVDVLKEVESNQLFARQIRNHVVRRDAEEDEEEGRGWRKNGKKKNKDRKNKKSRKDAAEGEDENEKEDTDATVPYTNGIQFSAYNSNQRPLYSAPPSPSPAPVPAPPVPVITRGKKYMYGLDHQGKPQFIDQATVCMLLKRSKRARQVDCQVNSYI